MLSGAGKCKRACAWSLPRAAYQKLKTTTLKTVQDWMPPAFGDIRLAAPMEGLFTSSLLDGTRVRFEVLFMAQEDEKDSED